MNAPIVRRAQMHAAAPQGAAVGVRVRASGRRCVPVGTPARIEAACRSGLTAFDR